MSFVPQNAKLWISVIALSAMLALLYFASNSTWNTFTLEGSSSNEVNLDGCYHVYLDVGTNVGIQVNINVILEKKLYILSITDS